MSDLNNLQIYLDRLNREKLLVEAAGNTEIPVASITFDSRKVSQGSLFVCKGVSFKQEFLDSAVEKGAIAYISEKKYKCPSDVCQIIVSDIRKAMPIISEIFYGKLSDKLKVIGITGTKGKSTVTYFVRTIFDEYMQAINKGRIAICSGIRNFDGVVDEKSVLTTAENFILYERMNNAVNSNIEYMVMEVSSQALKYDRTAGIEFEIACFNNIGVDHISPKEHKDFDDYFGSKLAIFKQSRRTCINMDSDYLDEILNASRDIYTAKYSTKNSDAEVFAYDIKSINGKPSFKVRGRSIDGYDDFDESFALGAFGEVNISNALAAITISAMCKVPMEYIKLGLSKASIPGRMQLFTNSQGNKVGLVDYAHNKLSFESLLSTVKKEFPNREIIMAFGSTGGKAINRREGMAEVANKYCKHIILTEDDPENESPLDICKEMASYLSCSYEIILDRPEAIRKLISLANDDNIVIAAGKSLEKHQNRDGFVAEIESDYEIFCKEFNNI